MAIVQHDYIHNRADFFDVLGRLIADTTRLRGSTPRPPFDSIQRQLEAIKQWTAGGRTPTREERRSITIGIIVVRELEPVATDELFDYTQRLHELRFYFALWWDDAEWTTMDDKDPRPLRISTFGE